MRRVSSSPGSVQLVEAPGLSVAGLFKIHKKEFDGYTTPLYPLLPIFFLGLTAVVLFFVGMQRPLNAIAGMLVVVLGIPAYYFLFRRRAELK